MKKYFYVASDFERNPEQKNFNIWEHVNALNEVAVLKAINTAFYINAKYEKAILRYGFTNLTEEQLGIQLNKS